MRACARVHHHRVELLAHREAAQVLLQVSMLSSSGGYTHTAQYAVTSNILHVYMSGTSRVESKYECEQDEVVDRDYVGSIVEHTPAPRLRAIHIHTLSFSSRTQV